MAATEDSLEPGCSGLTDRDCSYWFGELRQRGMTLSQIDTLLETPGTSFHELVEALDAGCAPEVAFQIFS